MEHFAGLEMYRSRRPASALWMTRELHPVPKTPS